MAELFDRALMILAPIIAAVVASSLTALFTHRSARRREDYAKKMKIVGWLEWLKNFLEQVDHPRMEGNRLHKLPWWANYAMQNIGDSLHLLREDTRKNLMSLVNECWVDGPVEYKLEGLTRVDAIYDKKDKKGRKIKDTMIVDIENLIKRTKDP